MQLALARCFSNSAVSAVLIDPLANNTRAHRFYERLGFRFVEHRRFGEDECLVYRLDRSDDTRAVQQGASADAIAPIPAHGRGSGSGNSDGLDHTE